MNLVWLNARIQLQELFRYPSVTVPSFALPTVSYLIFGLPAVGGDAIRADYVLLSFAAFSVLGIVMFQFGVGIAADRESPWERYVRTLPATPATRFAARLVVALIFSIISVVPLGVLGCLVSPVSLDVGQWLRTALALLIGSIPLGLLGIALGYLLTERGALPITNLLYLPLAYAGGLFSSGQGALPHAAAAVSPWLPTRQWSDLLHDFGMAGRMPLHPLLSLLGYGVVFAMIAVLAYRRDESRQYG
ncbi:MAG: ABC transporter permease [Jatrophihabitans sp.]